MPATHYFTKFSLLGGRYYNSLYKSVWFNISSGVILLVNGGNGILGSHRMIRRETLGQSAVVGAEKERGWLEDPREGQAGCA